MAELIVLYTNKSNAFKGDIVEVRGNSTGITLTEKNDFVLIKIPETLIHDLEGYRDIWFKSVDYEIVVHQATTDGYRIRAYSPLFDSLGNGKISLADIENYINNWGGSIHSSGDNEVVFDIGTYNIAISEPFLERNNLTGVIFNQDNYNQVTGVHTISANYSLKNWNPTSVEKYLYNFGVTIISHNNKIIVYQVQGTGDTGNHGNNFPLIKMKTDINKNIKNIVKKFRYRLPDAIVDSAVSNDYELQISEAQFLSEVIDKVYL